MATPEVQQKITLNRIKRNLTEIISEANNIREHVEKVGKTLPGWVTEEIDKALEEIEESLSTLEMWADDDFSDTI